MLKKKEKKKKKSTLKKGRKEKEVCCSICIILRTTDIYDVKPSSGPMSVYHSIGTLFIFNCTYSKGYI